MEASGEEAWINILRIKMSRRPGKQDFPLPMIHEEVRQGMSPSGDKWARFNGIFHGDIFLQELPVSYWKSLSTEQE